MRQKKQTLAAMVGLVLALAACSAPSNPPVSIAPPQPSSPAPAAPAPSAVSAAGVTGTVVRFTAGPETVDVTIDEDNPATRDFLGMLPLTLTLEEFNGREKIADLPRELKYQGSPGSDPEDGDLIYFTRGRTSASTTTPPGSGTPIRPSTWAGTTPRSKTWRVLRDRRPRSRSWTDHEQQRDTRWQSGCHPDPRRDRDRYPVSQRECALNYEHVGYFTGIVRIGMFDDLAAIRDRSDRFTAFRSVRA